MKDMLECCVKNSPMVIVWYMGKDKEIKGMVECCVVDSLK